MTPAFKIGDTIKVVSQIRDDDGLLIDISVKTIRSVMKTGTTEFVGSVQKLDSHTVQVTFQTNLFPAGKYIYDVRYSEGSESFSTPTVSILLGAKVS